MDDRLERLTAELRAIQLWDSNYHRSTLRDEIAESAYQSRQQRRREIIWEIAVDGWAIEIREFVLTLVAIGLV